MPKVSVIVPVYGVEKYIERCADSLFGQTLDDIEFIFVDDCTPDNSMGLLNAKIEKYRLRLAEMNWKVRTERMPTNSGLPAVRRHGIQLATGDYIVHCDSDDWIDSEMYESMYKKALSESLDMVVCDYCVHNGIKVKEIVEGCRANNVENYIDSLICHKGPWSLWHKMIKRSLYTDDICYPKDAMGEDFGLFFQLLLRSKTIQAILFLL